ncbi:MAG: hypothetical protein KGY99_03325 [Phycisphaerae bacterium]|nr:hypothetical protein [Phycisphaerae bacterium]
MASPFDQNPDPSDLLHTDPFLDPDALDEQDGRPLRPMPAASPREAAAWLRRLAIGAWGYLALMPVVVVGMVAEWMLGVAHPAAAYGTRPFTAVIALAAAWLLTMNEPKSRGWMRLRRWVVRLGAMLELTTWYLYLAIAGAAPVHQQINPYTLAAVYLGAKLTGGLCLLVELSYLRALARRLGDVVLRKNFTVLLWTIGILTALGFGLIHLWNWPTEVANIVDAAREAHSQPHVPPGMRDIAFPLGLIAALSSYFGWLMWRLGRRMRDAAAALEPRAARP